jgi:hypothetical protein
MVVKNERAELGLCSGSSALFVSKCDEPSELTDECVIFVLNGFDSNSWRRKKVRNGSVISVVQHDQLRYYQRLATGQAGAPPEATEGIPWGSCVTSPKLMRLCYEWKLLP